MKTYPIMLPSHGGEDVQAATLTEYQDGSCSIETGSSITTDHKAAAIDVIKRRWPSAYLAEAVRIEPEAAPEPTLGDLLNLISRLNGEGFYIDLRFHGFGHSMIVGVICNSGMVHEELALEVITNPEKRRRYALPTENVLAQNAIDWLTDLHKKYGNPAA